MADHAALKSQAEEAFAAAVEYYRSDDWTVIDTTEDFSTSLLPTSNVPVFKVEGPCNKTPDFFKTFMQKNGVKVREKHFRYHISYELVELFEDNSSVTKETLNIPAVGEVQQYRYYHWFKAGDGSYNGIGTSAKLDKYPIGPIELVFSLINIVPDKAGSYIRFFMKVLSHVDISVQTRLVTAHAIKDFYIGIAKEANEASSD